MPSEAGCFTEIFGSTKNTCGDPKYWIVPLPVDALTSFSGTYNTKVTARVFVGDISVSRVECFWYSISSWSPTAPLSQFNYQASETTWPTQSGDKTSRSTLRASKLSLLSRCCARPCRPGPLSTKSRADRA